MRKENQDGFSAIELILLIVIVAMLGFTGWYVWHVKQGADKTLTGNDSTTPIYKKKVGPTNTKSPTIPAQPSVNYFVIKEWGVQAPYSGSMNLKYVIGAPPYSSSNAYFTSTELTEADTTNNSICGINRSGASSTQNYGGGYVGRYLSTDAIPTEGPPGETAQQFVATGNDVSYSKVDNYYYIYWKPQGPCTSIQAAQNVEQQTEDAVKSVVKSLQAIPN